MDVNEYSIERFKKDYTRIINSYVLPLLGQYEATRKKHIIKLLMNIIAKLVILLLCFFALYEFFQFTMYLKVHPWTFIIFEKPSLAIIYRFILIILVSICIIVLSSIDKITKSFEKEIKPILPLIINALQIFHIEKKAHPTNKEIINSQIFNTNNPKADFESCVIGEYKNYQISLTDLNYEISDCEDFTGTLIKIKLKQNTESTTIIRPEKAENEDLRNKKFEKFEINDEEFMDEYQIYTTNQLKANYLLNADFVEKLKNISGSFCSGEIYCSIKDDTIYIANSGANGLFSIDSLFKPITDEKQFQRISEEFVSILELVEYLNTKS